MFKMLGFLIVMFGFDVDFCSAKLHEINKIHKNIDCFNTNKYEFTIK